MRLIALNSFGIDGYIDSECIVKVCRLSPPREVDYHWVVVTMVAAAEILTQMTSFRLVFLRLFLRTCFGFPFSSISLFRFLRGGYRLAGSSWIGVGVMMPCG